MLERMKDLATEKNNEIASYHLKCMGDSASLRAAGDHVKANALISLSPVGFQLWLTESNEARYYVKASTMADSEMFEVRRVNTNAPPRLVGASRRCDCEERIAMMAQCRHEICVFGFRLDLFAKRYYQQTGLPISNRTDMLECNGSKGGKSKGMTGSALDDD
jgi:hypothetical protein